MEVTSLICLCSVQYHYPSPLLGLQCVFFSSPASVFYCPFFLISGVERLSRFQCLKSLEKAVLLVRLGSASQWQWGGYSLATNQKYPCGKLINIPLLGEVEKRDHGIASWLFPGNLFFFLFKTICVFDNTAASAWRRCWKVYDVQTVGFTSLIHAHILSCTRAQPIWSIYIISKNLLVLHEWLSSYLGVHC